MKRCVLGAVIAMILGCDPLLEAQQISVPRIDLMPNRPSPYQMRDWKKVAQEYDSLVFNFGLTGTYLPLVWLNTNTVNYPSQNSFGLNTVVGTTDPSSAEAINCLPAVIGATLTGADKTSQGGYNWVLMSQEWFNNRPEQNVYMNHPVDDTGDDWWYETMPNVFFYQINALYPGIGHSPAQFDTVADRWLQAVRAMGGSTTPWQIPNMDHRGWYLQTMTPYDIGVHEPEAAGAIGWILYDAWVQTGDPKYRAGAEMAMDFLNGRSTNPAYELQLAYGTYLAARMNGELGTTYDVPKMVNWCFNVGPLRSWGAIVGTWGGYDCSGLIGEVNGTNDYAFAMNTFEQIGALVPLVRYDDRFARAVGKWVLNAANAVRLFYPNYLPDLNQDSYQWAHQYDSSSVIAHEALRQYNSSISPYATGDAISGGWGATTLTLYGSSHAGILGGIIDTTQVPMILRLDLLKTDYYHDSAYPTYLYYNPYDTATSVAIEVGGGMHDIYETTTNRFLFSGVTGSIALQLPPDSALVVVVVPAGGSVSYDLDKMLVNGRVVDYRSGAAVANYPPRIRSLAADRSPVLRGDTVNVFCTAMDRNGDTLSYSWQASGGTTVGSGASVRWALPDSIGIWILHCVVTDGHGGSDSAAVAVSVVAAINNLPVVRSLTALPRKIDLGATSQITCTASDPDSDALQYGWSADTGTISGSGPSVSWTAPGVAGNHVIRCLVDDGRGGQVADSIGIEVRDLSIVQSGDLVAYYPFSGNANDASGNNRTGSVSGATLVPDRFGTPNSAYAFNGTSSVIQVPNDAGLNFQNAISVAFWMKVGAFYTREQYPISHGNWVNRWKLSISPTSNTLRWTVKTATGPKDLDSETHLSKDSAYYVTALYSGSDYELWINGQLDAFSSLTGLIQQTTYGLSIGQDLPNDNNYNFNGILDEVRIYNYALSVREIDSLFNLVTSVHGRVGRFLPAAFALEQNYPNPFNPTTTIMYRLPVDSKVTMKVFNVLGEVVATLVDERERAGYKSVVWSAAEEPSGIYFCRMTAGKFTDIRKLVLIK